MTDYQPLTFDTSLDLIQAVQGARTLCDIGVCVWLLRGHCSPHGEIDVWLVTDGPAPDVRFVDCPACAVMGIQKRVPVDDMVAVGEKQ